MSDYVLVWDLETIPDLACVARVNGLAVGDDDLCATDAACEGLNLQRLGAQVNVDMPWNPSRLEQRKGRVQRIGQIRDNVHVLNLRYAGTVEDDVYTALSNRFGDIFSVLGQLPDAFEDDWIAAVLKGRSAVLNFSQRVETAKPPMELRYNQHTTIVAWIGSRTIGSDRHRQLCPVPPAAHSGGS